jgi:hypothetical protein
MPIRSRGRFHRDRGVSGCPAVSCGAKMEANSCNQAANGHGCKTSQNRYLIVGHRYSSASSKHFCQMRGRIPSTRRAQQFVVRNRSGCLLRAGSHERYPHESRRGLPSRTVSPESIRSCVPSAASAIPAEMLSTSVSEALHGTVPSVLCSDRNLFGPPVVPMSKTAQTSTVRESDETL